tara:strand:- start:973 stop:1320 length:348 start_codon:yes stop_codon:yes gene_type:complete
MSQEYVYLNPQEFIYGEKNLLQTQLELLQFIKKIYSYKDLRKEELALKIVFKKKIGELSDTLKDLKKLLPHVNHEYLPHPNSPATIKRPKISIKEKLSLEQEIAEIRHKIEELRQ